LRRGESRQFIAEMTMPRLGPPVSTHLNLFLRPSCDIKHGNRMSSEPPAASQRTTIAPMLSVRRGASAVEFYQRALGAEVLFRLDGDGGGVVAQLAVQGAGFWVADESPSDANFSPETLGGGTVRMILVVGDPDALFAQAVAAGAVVVSPMTDHSYGWRVGRVVDPFGHHWEIGKPLD
jgi:PhnB protein